MFATAQADNCVFFDCKRYHDQRRKQNTVTLKRVERNGVTVIPILVPTTLTRENPQELHPDDASETIALPPKENCIPRAFTVFIDCIMSCIFMPIINPIPAVNTISTSEKAENIPWSNPLIMRSFALMG